MSALSALNLTPILSTGSMRKLDASSKTFLAEKHKESPTEQDVIQSGYTLMQEAGLALFKHVQAKSLEPVAVFIGGGNNGGDGLVLHHRERLLGRGGSPESPVRKTPGRSRGFFAG